MTDELPQTPEDAVRRFPRLTGHLICESLGYFTVRSAGAAIVAYLSDEPFGCEWYSHISQCQGTGMFDNEAFLSINRQVVSSAIRRRHEHRGYMTEYAHAKSLVDRFTQTGDQNELASWF